MDKETKQMIAKLCSSIDATQAEIETLKKGTTVSGKSLAGSQDSDLVPCN